MGRFFILIFILFSCSHGIERGYSPSLKYEIESDSTATASAKTLYGEIYIKKMDAKSWQKLSAFPPYVNVRSNLTDFMAPPLESFFIIIKNSSDFPLFYAGSEMRTSNLLQQDLGPDELAAELSSPSYHNFNHKRMLSLVRLAAERRTLEEIEMENDLIDSDIGYIPPGDSAVRVIHFRWVSPWSRYFTLRVSLLSGGMKKVIDFDFRKFEYRTDGDHFLKPRRRDGDSD